RLVMHGDAVYELRELRRVEPFGAFLDQPEPEMNMSEQPSLRRHRERRPAPELERPPDVVYERRGEQQVRAQPRMELRRLACERRDADRVLEQAAGVGVMVIRRRRVRAQLAIREHGRDRRAQPRMRDLRDEELEKADQLVLVAADRRSEGL